MIIDLNMENLDEQIDALAQDDEIIKFAEKMGTEPDRLAKWLVVTVGPNVKNVPTIINLLLDMAEMHA